MWNFLKWFSRNSVPTNRDPKSRKPVKPQGMWELATVKESDPLNTDILFMRGGGKKRVIPLRSDTFRRLNLGSLKKGDSFQIRMGNTHLGPEVAAIRPLKK